MYGLDCLEKSRKPNDPLIYSIIPQHVPIPQYPLRTQNFRDTALVTKSKRDA